MSINRWATPEAISTLLTTELNSLADLTMSAVSAAVDNETDRFLFVNLEINLVSLTPASGAVIAVYFFPTLDGTNYFDVDSNFLDRALTTITLHAATGAQRIGREGVELPPLKGKFALMSFVGVSLGASGNTLKIRRHNGESA